VTHNVLSEPELDAMGINRQFFPVLPARRAVVVMTSMLSIDGGLRDADNVKTFRRIVNDYVLPALSQGARDAAAGDAALRKELDLAHRTRGVPAAPADPTDTPRL
jgi:hypothetical protein